MDVPRDGRRYSIRSLGLEGSPKYAKKRGGGAKKAKSNIGVVPDRIPFFLELRTVFVFEAEVRFVHAATAGVSVKFLPAM